MTISKPPESEYNSYYREYIRRVPAGNVLAFLESQLAETLALLRGLSEREASARPAPGEWNIQQIVGHLSDTERIFAYRALRFGRGDEIALPGFYHNPYVENGHFEQRSLADLLDEFAAIRRANLFLFRNFSTEDTLRVGNASGNEMSVRALIYCCAGHEHHHLESIRTVYLGMAE
jgi:hypothetical protein